MALKEGIVDVPAASSVVEIDLGAEAVAASDAITESITDAVDAIPEPETIVAADRMSGTGEDTSVNLEAEAKVVPDTILETVAVDTIPESEATETLCSTLSNASENNLVVECNTEAEGVVGSDAMIDTVTVGSIAETEAVSTSDKSEAAQVVERSLEAEEVVVNDVTSEAIAELEATDTASEAAITQSSEATLESSSMVEDISPKQDDATELTQPGKLYSRIWSVCPLPFSKLNISYSLVYCLPCVQAHLSSMQPPRPSRKSIASCCQRSRNYFLVRELRKPLL